MRLLQLRSDFLPRHGCKRDLFAYASIVGVHNPDCLEVKDTVSSSISTGFETLSIYNHVHV